MSVGGLPTVIALDDILLGLSVCRNPKLVAVFYRLKPIEAYGTSMPKIMNAYEWSGLNPKIIATNNAFKTTLPNRNFVAQDTGFRSKEPLNYKEQILPFVSLNGHIVRSRGGCPAGCQSVALQSHFEADVLHRYIISKI